MVAGRAALALALACVLSTLGASALFDHSNVVKLDNGNFKEKVGDGKVHFIKFYAPWCGHCKKMAPTWSELADAYAGSEAVTIAQVDCTAADAVCKEAGVGGYPTLKTFHNGQEHDVFRGARTLDAFKEHLDAAVKELTTETVA